MLKAYKYRLYPTPDQAVMLAKHFGCVRFVYNRALFERKNAYEQEKRTIKCNDQIKELRQLKKSEETLWLGEVYSQSLQMCLRNLDGAYTNFFKKRGDFPKFKRKSNKQSFQIPQGAVPDFNAKTVDLPKIGHIEAVFSRTFRGQIKTSTVSKTPSGKFFISILVENAKTLPAKSPISAETAVGIDVGLTTFATLSTGEKIENPKNLKKSQKRLKFLQRKHSRKQIAGKNREKSRKKVARLHERVVNQRTDFLHKLTTSLVRENQTVIVENLNVAGMMKNHKLALGIADVSWSEFFRQLEYKAAWSGKNFVQIGRFEPTSKRCKCGELNQTLTLKDRVWTCAKCGLTHDRDLLAAWNIKELGLLTEIGGDAAESTLGEFGTVVPTLNQEPIFH